MKTIFYLDKTFDKRKIILKHDKDVKIQKEIRKDHIEWTDLNGKPIKDRRYIVIRYPKNKNIQLDKWKRTYDDRFFVGFMKNDIGDEIELLFYDRGNFSSELYELEKTGLFKVRQRIIPDKENGESFPFYINARGFREWSFNILFGCVQIFFEICKKAQRKKERKV